MVEKYIKFKMFFEYELPLIILGVLTVIFLFLVICGLIIDKWNKRQKKHIDEYFKEEEN